MIDDISQIDLRFKYPCLTTRIKNEYNELVKFYDVPNKYEIFITYDNILNNATITLIEKNFNNKYSFIIDKKYPFNPPIFHFNNQPYSHYLKLPSKRFADFLKIFTNKSCLCCSSLSCKYNWTPAIKLRMFIKELNQIRQFKRNIVYKIASDKIKETYLIDDIDIESFIF
jgi:hypothetical protein